MSDPKQQEKEAERMAIAAIQGPIVERVKSALGIKKDKPLAEKFGLRPSSISNYRNGQRPLPLEIITTTTKETGLPYAWFFEGTKDDVSSFHQEFDLIPKYKARLSGGHGSLETSDMIEANLAFRKEFIRSKGNGNNMALFEVVGDSMEPFIYDGDVVMVDLSHADPNAVTDGKAYAFREDDTVKVKRLSRQGGKLIATSENHQKYPPYEVDVMNFNLLGKVVWVGHEVK